MLTLKYTLEKLKIASIFEKIHELTGPHSMLRFSVLFEVCTVASCLANQTSILVRQHWEFMYGKLHMEPLYLRKAEHIIPCGPLYFLSY